MKKKILITYLLLIGAAAAVCSCSRTNDSQPSETEPAAVSETSATAIETLETTEPSIETTVETEPEEDVTAPFFMNINREVYVTQNNEFDINEYISYIDDHDSDVELTVDGYVDMSTLGTYYLDLCITDDAGNSKTDSMSVTVVAPVEPGSEPDYPAGNTTDYATSFETFMNSYPGDDVHYGIDVSHWQGAIDWQQVADAGCEFVIIRAGWSSGGEFHLDDYFNANIEGASAVGLHIGVYVYTTDNTIEDVEALADTICDMTEGYNVDMPIVFDWENFFNNFQRYSLSIDDINDLYLAFEQRVESRGLTSTLYASKFVLEVIWDDSIEPVWLAHYTSQTDYAGLYNMWQQSCTGSIPGIDAYVDMDLFYGDLPGG